MDPAVTGDQTAAVEFGTGHRPETATQVRVAEFEGPLGLLLNLIEAQKLDVLSVPLGALAGAYLEALAETGLLGGLCCAWFLIVLLLKSFSRFRQNDFSLAGALQLSGIVACAGFLVHALVDFNFHIPSNLWLFFFMAHLATADMQQLPSAPAAHRRHRHSAKS